MEHRVEDEGDHEQDHQDDERGQRIVGHALEEGGDLVAQVELAEDVASRADGQVVVEVASGTSMERKLIPRRGSRRRVGAAGEVAEHLILPRKDGCGGDPRQGCRCLELLLGGATVIERQWRLQVEP